MFEFLGKADVLSRLEVTKFFFELYPAFFIYLWVMINYNWGKSLASPVAVHILFGTHTHHHKAMRQVLSLLELGRVNYIFEEALLFLIHHLHILFVRPQPNVFIFIGRNGFVLLYYLRSQLLFHGILYHR